MNSSRARSVVPKGPPLQSPCEPATRLRLIAELQRRDGRLRFASERNGWFPSTSHDQLFRLEFLDFSRRQNRSCRICPLARSFGSKRRKLAAQLRAAAAQGKYSLGPHWVGGANARSFPAASLEVRMTTQKISMGK